MRAPAAAREPMEPAPKPRRALLVGQPNVGKSVVFGALTGTYVTVSNYPGTTVEVTRGRAKFGDRVWEVIDTPGTHNLVPMSEDESVTRDILLREPHDALVQVGDAKGLSRTLLLTLQIAELGIPFCLDLNMLDEARARGVRVDLEALERELVGVRVNASTATEGEGLDAVRDYLESRPGAVGRRRRASAAPVRAVASPTTSKRPSPTSWRTSTSRCRSPSAASPRCSLAVSAGSPPVSRRSSGKTRSGSPSDARASARARPRRPDVRPPQPPAPRPRASHHPARPVARRARRWARPRRTRRDGSRRRPRRRLLARRRPHVRGRHGARARRVGPRRPARRLRLLRRRRPLLLARPRHRLDVAIAPLLGRRDRARDRPRAPPRARALLGVEARRGVHRRLDGLLFRDGRRVARDPRVPCLASRSTPGAAAGLAASSPSPPRAATGGTRAHLALARPRRDRPRVGPAHRRRRAPPRVQDRRELRRRHRGRLRREPHLRRHARERRARRASPAEPARHRHHAGRCPPPRRLVRRRGPARPRRRRR